MTEWPAAMSTVPSGCMIREMTNLFVQSFFISAIFLPEKTGFVTFTETVFVAEGSSRRAYSSRLFSASILTRKITRSSIIERMMPITPNG